MSRTYTEDDRGAALEIYVEHGAKVASQRTGVSAQTIRSWASRRGVVTERAGRQSAATKAMIRSAAEKRVRLREQLLDKALDALGRMDEPHIDFRGSDCKEVRWDRATSGAMKDYATTAAILIDKLRLEEGQVTGRQEHVHADATDLELRRLADELRAHAGGPLPLAAQGPPEADHAGG